MKPTDTPTPDKPSAAPEALLTWKVAATPAGESTLKIGGIRAGKGALVKLSKSKADALNSILPGCLTLQGV